MTIKEQTKQLWKKCFDDTEEFVEMYFDHCYNDDINIVLQRGDQVISALQMIPYSMTYPGEVISASYISGACTDPDFRGRGVMRELLLQSFIRMKQRDIPVSTLIPAEPWLFDYYKKMGYASVFKYSKVPVNIADTTPGESSRIINLTAFNENAYEYYESRQCQRLFRIQHTKSDFKVVIEDLFISGGKYLVAKQQGKITGIAFVVPQDSGTIINELIADNNDAGNALIYEAGKLFYAEDLFIIQPPEGSTEIHDLGMARIIDAEKMLDLYARANPEIMLHILLTDEMIRFNSGYYNIKGGRCIKGSEESGADHISMNIGELTELLFSGGKPYMSLMLN